jgi:hypothetical protein
MGAREWGQLCSTLLQPAYLQHVVGLSAKHCRFSTINVSQLSSLAAMSAAVTMAAMSAVAAMVAMAALATLAVTAAMQELSSQNNLSSIIL